MKKKFFPQYAFIGALLLGTFLFILALAVLYYVRSGRSKEKATETPQAVPAPAPEASVPADWLTASGAIAFRYPADLGTTYIHAQAWPPQAQVLDTPFSCAGGGNELMEAGKIAEHTVGGQVYCATEKVGAAAGSTYTQYTYTFPKQGKTLIFVFTLQSPQCDNFADDSQKSACVQEEASFDVSGLVDMMARSVK